MTAMERRTVVVATSAALMITALAGRAAAKTVPDQKYVKAVCGHVHKFTGSLDATGNAFTAIATTDPATYQTQAGALVDKVIVTVTSTRAKLKKLSPEDGGKKVTKLFDTYFKQLGAKMSAAVATFRKADPNGVAFQGDIVQLGAAFTTLTVGVDDPFSKVTDQDLLHAFGADRSCNDIVSIIGG